jgi:DegV family protein with EDD domain
MSDARVAVVTDSTSYLPAELVRERGIAVVPLQVVIGGTSYDEGADASSGTVAEALRTWQPVTTSRPGPAAFAAAYASAAEAGCAAVVSVHLSAQMSGTVESARLAAKDSPVPVEVVDSESLGMGLGYAVLSAAAVRRMAAPPTRSPRRPGNARRPRTPCSTWTPSSTCAGAAGSAQPPPCSAPRSP